MIHVLLLVKQLLSVFVSHCFHIVVHICELTDSFAKELIMEDFLMVVSIQYATFCQKYIDEVTCFLRFKCK